MERSKLFTRSLWILTTLAATAIPTRGQAVRDATPATKPPPGQPAAGRGDAAGQGKVSESDCLAYAQAVTKAVAASDRSGLNALVDWDSVLETVFAGWDIPDKSRQEFSRGIRRSIDGDNGLASQLIKNSKLGGSLSFLRARQREGRQVVLFRMIPPIGQIGLSYFEFVPRRSAGDQVRATDIYIYAAGEFVTETVRRGLLPLVANQSRTFLDKLMAGERDFVRDLPQLGQAVKVLQQGKSAEALAILKTMRPETRKHKMILLLRLRAAQGSDMKEYAEAIEDFRRLYPNDPSMELIAIDASVLQGDFPGAMKAVDGLDKTLGGDPFLDVTRAGIREAQGDLEGARRFARQAVEREPSLLPGHLALLAYSLKAEKYDETLARLKEIDRMFHVRFGDLSRAPKYAGFVKSAKYSEWLDYLKTKKPTPEQAPSR